MIVALTRAPLARSRRLPAFGASRRPKLTHKRHADFPGAWPTVCAFVSEALVLRHRSEGISWKRTPTFCAITCFVLKTLSTVCTRSEGTRTALLATAPCRECLRWFGCMLFFDGHICAIRPYLWQLLTVPAETQDVLTFWQVRDLHTINDTEWKCSMCHLLCSTRRNSACARTRTKSKKPWSWWFEHGSLALVIMASCTRYIVAWWDRILRPGGTFRPHTFLHTHCPNLCTVVYIKPIAPLNPLFVTLEIQRRLLKTLLCDLTCDVGAVLFQAA